MKGELLAIIIVYFVNSFISLGIGIFVFVKNRKSIVNITFSLMAFSCFLWMIFWAFAFSVKEMELSRILMSWGSIMSIFIPVFTAHLILVLIGKNKEKKRALRFIYLVSFLMVFFELVFFNKFFPTTTPKLYFNYYPDSGPLHKIFTFLFFSIFFYAFYHLIKAYKISTGEQRNRLRYVILASVASYVCGTFSWMPQFNPKIDPFLSSFSAVGYIVPTAYAILKYQLMDIRLVIKKTFFYSVGIALVSGVITGITFLSSWFVQVIPGFQFWTVPLFVGIVTFFIGNIFWRQSKKVEKAYTIEKQARQELEHLSEVKDQFLLTTQHHLRTPLTIMKGYLSVLLAKKQELDLKTQEDYTEKTLNSTNRLIKLVNELLDVSELQIGKKPLHLQPTNIRILIEDILKDLQGEISVKNLNVKINQESWPLIPVDPEKLRIALYNIIDNAVKYTAQGEIVIQGQPTNDSFQLSIQDTGIGINPEEMKTLFTKYFERGEQAQKMYTIGRGIGLFIAANIIKLHQGRIWAESEGIGKGMRVVVELTIG